MYIYIYTVYTYYSYILVGYIIMVCSLYTRYPETPRKGTFLKKGTFFHRIVMLAEESCLEAGDLFLARMYDVCCAAMLGLANSWHHSYCAEDAHAAADIHGHPGHCWKLLDRYCSKLRPFVPFGLHIQMICPLLATRTDGCSSVDRSLNVPEIFKAAL